MAVCFIGGGNHRPLIYYFSSFLLTDTEKLDKEGTCTSKYIHLQKDMEKVLGVEYFFLQFITL
jgi:hypothetical protein